MSERATPAVLAALREGIQGQIDSGDPPETAFTLTRLQADGMSGDEAWRLLSAVLLQELSAMVRDNRPFDRGGYIAALNRLPGLIER